MRINVARSVREDARHRGRGFTLVELTVVVVTLALLSALVLPALARQGDNGARLVCINNLRQMGRAATMYAGDNRNYLPYCNWDGGNAPGPGWLYGSGLIPDPTVAPYTANPISAWQTGLLFKYVQNQNYYLCPVDIESANYLSRQDKLSSYVMSGAVSGFVNGGYLSCKVTDAWSPQCWLLWEPDANGFGGTFSFNDGANYPVATDGGPGEIHTVNGSEILSVAGGVAFTTTQNILTNENATGPGPGGKNLAWWNPFSNNGH